LLPSRHFNYLRKTISFLTMLFMSCNTRKQVKLNDFIKRGKSYSKSNSPYYNNNTQNNL
jgi:hypothetical protein